MKREKIKLPCFVPPTPGSQLAKALQAAEAKDSQGRNTRIRVVERAGPTHLSKLQKTDPSPKAPCPVPSCLPCTSGELGTCRVNSIVYKITCTACGTAQGPDATPPAAPTPTTATGTQGPNPATRTQGCTPQGPGWPHLCWRIGKEHAHQRSGTFGQAGKEGDLPCHVEALHPCSSGRQ